MSTVINTNIAAIRTHNVYNKNNDYMNQALTRVATGQKVNSAKDNASTYAITEKMRDRIRANDQANQNVQNDTALLKTAQGGIANTIDILKTLKERAINAANDSNINTDRGAIQTEVNQLLAQIEENAQKVKFNGRILLNGSAGNDITTASAATASATTVTSTTTYAWSAASGDISADGNAPADVKAAIQAYLTENSLTKSAGDTLNLSDITTLASDNTGTPVSSGEVKLTSGGEWQNTSSSAAITGLYIRGAGTTTATTGTTSVGTPSGSSTTQTGLNFYVGGESGFNVSFTLDDMTLTGLALKDSSGNNLVDVTDSSKAQSSIDVIDDALETALQAQTKAGAMEARLGYTSDNIVTMNENLESATSTMRDADIAKEMTTYMKYAVLSQASQYMLAQAGQNAFSVLNLLQA